MAKKIFISKNAQELEHLSDFCTSQEIKLTAHSFLQFEEAPFSIQHPFDVIFFSSPRSVMFFVNKHSLAKNILIACIGGKTKAVVESLGATVDFLGKSSNPIQTAGEFAEWLGDRRVLFPLSDRSKKTISSAIPDDQKEEVIAYKTLTNQFRVDSHDIYVFSSPSNVDGFFDSENQIETDHIISWGTTTQAALQEHGLQSTPLQESSISCLIATLKEKFI